MDMIDDLKKKLEDVIDLLPPIPAVMTELVQALGDIDIELRALAHIISKDPLMSMNVLKVSNSALYRLPNKVATVDHAVKLLGIKEITGICIACGAYQSLKAPHNVETFNLDDFWRHSVATGVVSRRLCQELEILDHNVLYFLGLLHDVGKVVLDRFAHDIYKIVVQTTREENITIQEAEKRLIGESHDVVGGWLMEKWRLPWTFVDVAKYHHDVKESPEDNKTGVAIIAIADRLAWLHYLGLDPGFNVTMLTDNEAYSFLERTTSTMEDIDFVKFMQELDTANEEIDEMTNILQS
jgi:putative nucleotidyltransferase with HDIG domain